MFIRRELESRIKDGAQQVPVVAIIGPRQSGKSTLIKNIFPHYAYVDMQDAQLFEFANTDPKGFLRSYKDEEGLIIDEAQYAPKLFMQLKVEVDKDPRPGRYILSGSQNFLLHEKISESLAGRAYFYTLLPFSTKELKSGNLLCDSVEDQMIKGFYPRMYQPHMQASDFYPNYVSTYVERDIRTIRNIENILAFKKFMRLCAVRIGSPLNFADLATHCGVSVITIKGWLSLLETSFVLFLLPSYHNNLGKRITKSPRIYFYDVGLAIALMGIERDTLIKKRELHGALFENMVIVDIMKNLEAQGKAHVLTFFRGSNKKEVDVIIESGGRTMPIEIKSSETMQDKFFDTLEWFKGQVEDCQDPVVVYGGERGQTRSRGRVVSWMNLERILSQI